MPWTNIPNANLAAGAPIRSVDILALRDNISAVPDGDAGAPTITGKAIRKASAFPAVTVSATPATYNINSSDNFTNTYGTTATGSTSFVTALTITVTRINGSARFNAGFVGQNAGESFSYMRVLKNGVELQSWTWPTNSSGTRDISVVVGDTITWQIRSQVNGWITYFSEGAINANNGYTRTTPILLFSEL